ncbi:MAG TPA: hypothetical protein EYN79_07480 [Planctomycetes bacterium]|nr:hypothetical protein [Planctomycetota bacterium]HIN80261.1 hypothetical protein [Planctomycetota bacterium]
MAQNSRSARWLLALVLLGALALGFDGYRTWVTTPYSERVLIAFSLEVVGEGKEFPAHHFEADGTSFPSGSLVRCLPFPGDFQEVGDFFSGQISGEMDLHPVSTVASFEEIAAELFPGLEFSITSSMGDRYKPGESRYPRIFSRLGRCRLRRDDGAVDPLYLVALDVPQVEANSTAGEAGSEIVAGPAGPFVALLRLRDVDGKVLWPHLGVNAALVSRWREGFSKRVDVGHVVTFFDMGSQDVVEQWKPREPDYFRASAFFEAVPAE